jgi:hypothetical protein
MGRTSTWKNAPGEFVCGVYIDRPYAFWMGERAWFTDDDGRQLPGPISKWLSETYPAERPDGAGVVLTIHFVSNGYSDPGNFHNPPEGDDEREVTAVTTEDGDEMPAELFNDAWEFWEKDIYATDVDKAPDYEGAW